jgi:glyoxylase-like metal-dependent hydrolase (beta-lactamase superfamily II)
MQSRGFSTGDLKAIFLTHAHFDHAGSVAEMQRQTGAKIILHQSEAAYLKNGFTRIPKGTTPLFKFISNMGRKGRNGRIEKFIGAYEPAEPDILFNDSLSLESLGFDAEIIHSPGHTVGSSTLITGDTALVGDAMFNLNGNYYPGFANDEETLAKTWKKLIDLNVRWYYPSHGKRIEKGKLIEFVRKKGIIF